MKNDKIRFLLCVLFFTALAAITFRCAWPTDHVFSASDLNIGRLALKKNALPELLSGYFTANLILGSSNYAVSLFHLVLSCFPLIPFANMFYGVILVAGSVFLVCFLRLWSRSWLASIFGALVAFWFNSIMLATAGHAYKMEVLVFSVISLYLIEKAVRADRFSGSVGYGLLAGLSAGIMLMEQQDVAFLAGLFMGSYTLFRLIQLHRKQFARWLAVLVPIAAVALLLSMAMMLKSYKGNIEEAAAVQGDPKAKWNFVTQWSMVPSEWPDLIASGWSGWSSNNPDGPYWGKIGQADEWKETQQGFRNFKLTSIYFGIIPFLLGAFGMACSIRQRKTPEGAVMLFWCIAGLLGFWLAFGKYSILYKLFYQLPLVGNIRAPIKLLDNFQICLGIVAAYGLDALIAWGREHGAGSADIKATSSSGMLKTFWIAGFSVAGLMLLAGLKILVMPDGQISLFTKMGFGAYAEVMARNMSNAWLNASVLAFACAGLVFVVWRGFKSMQWVGLAFVAILAIDSLLLTSRYFDAIDVSAIKRGNALINYLKEHQEDGRTFFVDQSGIYNQWLASDGPYHGLNLFNIWQMPRMPVEYKEFLRTVGRNQIRLWELSAVKYVAAPAAIMQQLNQNPELGRQFKPVLQYQVPTAQGMRQDVLLEFNGAIPRFALFSNWVSVPIRDHCKMLASKDHSPRTTVLVDEEAGLSMQKGSAQCIPIQAVVSKKSAVMEVEAEVPSILRFSQRYQPGWRVLVDGETAPLLRVDYLCMGVSVPPGKHRVEFLCVDSSAQLLFSSAVFVVALCGGLACILFGSKQSNREG